MLASDSVSLPTACTISCSLISSRTVQLALPGVVNVHVTGGNLADHSLWIRMLSSEIFLPSFALSTRFNLASSNTAMDPEE